MREPLIRISKQSSLPKWAGWLIRIGGLFLSLVVCGILLNIMFGLNPIIVYVKMANGIFGFEYVHTFRDMLVYAIPWIRDTLILLLIAIGLAPAFKMRFWNIGAEGQIMVGAIAAAACMIKLGDSAIPNWILLVMMGAAAMVAGAAWGALPAISKSYWNTNETLFTLMMNYVAIQLTMFLIPLWEQPKGSNSIGVINRASKAGWFPPVLNGETTGTNVTLTLLLVAAVCVLMFFYLRNSKQGYEIAVVGESENTARYAGISVRKVIIRSMLISGAICGLAGFVTVAGADHTLSETTAGGRGFTAIIVAWLAKFNTFIMIAIAALIVFLEKGAIALATEFGVSNDVSHMITGIVLFFVLASEFFVNYRVQIRGLSKGRK